MDPYAIPFEKFSRLRPWPFTKVADVAALNRVVAQEVARALKKAMKEKCKLVVICPVGPLDYSYWAEEMNRENLHGSALVTVNMDEYIGDDGALIPETHPMSFRRFMKEGFFNRLKNHARVPPENIVFPDPLSPGDTTAFIESCGGADLCYGGMGITGHFAFNDPPPRDQPCSNDEVRSSRTRTLRIGPESQTQMCMGGTGGNWDLLPERAVTLGMHELLMSKQIHLTFMRSWHAGVLRRALFGPVTGRCPGSFMQQHANLRVTVTELAAKRPLVHVAQRIAE